MKVEKSIDKSELKELLKTEYGLDVKNLVFVPKGEVSYVYIVECESKKYVLKIYDTDSRMGREVVETLDFTLKVNFDLFSKCGIKNISHPIQTKSGTLKTYFNQQPAVLLNFVDGHEAKLSALEIGQLAKLLASIHESTAKLGLQNPVIDKFDTSWKRDLIEGLNTLDDDKKLDNQYKRQLRDLLLPIKPKILAQLEKLEGLSKVAKQVNKELVICHRDAGGANVIVDKERNVYILDWDGAILAPVEEDTWFFLEKQAETFIPAYRSVRDINFDVRIISYCLYNRYLEDLTDWVWRILYENTTDEQNEHDIEGIKSDCLDDVENIDHKIEEIGRILDRY